MTNGDIAAFEAAGYEYAGVYSNGTVIFTRVLPGGRAVMCGNADGWGWDEFPNDAAMLNGLADGSGGPFDTPAALLDAMRTAGLA